MMVGGGRAVAGASMQDASRCSGTVVAFNLGAAGWLVCGGSWLPEADGLDLRQHTRAPLPIVLPLLGMQVHC
jgi:hypothetical protein